MWAMFKVSVEFVTVSLLFCFFGQEASGIWLPDQVWNPHVLHWKGKSTPGPPGSPTRKPHSRVFFNKEFTGEFQIAYTSSKTL